MASRIHQSRKVHSVQTVHVLALAGRGGVECFAPITRGAHRHANKDQLSCTILMCYDSEYLAVEQHQVMLVWYEGRPQFKKKW